MTRPLSEDDIYRTSSQYRLWSFSPESLARLRGKTHEVATARVQWYSRNGTETAGHGGDGKTSSGDGDGPGAEFLTAAEELRLVQKYCDQIRATCDHFKWPVNVKATAIQYLKRFYVTNSCMVLPPREIYKTVLFLASKTEATHMTLSEYARRIATDPEHVLAPEYKVMQALRFTLDVRHPFRGLKGVLMELLNLAAAMASSKEEAAVQQLAQEMVLLDGPSETSTTVWVLPKAAPVGESDLRNRINAAYTAARNVLDSAALLTDAYFLYTPSQILLAAMHLADSPLTSWYLDLKLSASGSRPKVLASIHSCAEMLASFSQKTILTKDEREALEKKLESCRDPTTKDLVKVFAAQKQGAGDGEEDADSKGNRRKMEREKSLKEGEDLFGPDLKPTVKANDSNG